jgi:hypothetical protein
MTETTKALHLLDNFGDVAAEDDAVLDYFVATNAVERIEKGEAFLVLGRKGTGKTAIVRYFTERQGAKRARSLSLKGYPWNVHAARIDKGASDVEAYVSSWKYLLSVELASLALAQDGAWRSDAAQNLTNFLTDNYGSTTPNLKDILRPSKLNAGNSGQPDWGCRVGSYRQRSQLRSRTQCTVRHNTF